MDQTRLVRLERPIPRFVVALSQGERRAPGASAREGRSKPSYENLTDGGQIGMICGVWSDYDATCRIFLNRFFVDF